MERLLSEARSKAEKQEEKMINEAKAERQRILARAKEEAGLERARVADEMKREMMRSCRHDGCKGGCGIGDTGGSK